MDNGLALSVLDWWEEAGVDVLVEDVTRDWLAPLPPTAAEPVTSTPAAPPPAPLLQAAALPSDLPAFRAFLLADAAVPGPAPARLEATGDPASGTMIVLDMPEAGDRAAGRLLSGEVGDLFDRMLAAAQMSRETVYLVPFSPARPASGRLSPDLIEAFARLMRHHIGLAAPKRLLLMGDAPARGLLGLGALEARGRAHDFTGDRGTIPAVVSFHPRLLLQTPARKAAAWADLKIFMTL